MNRVRRICVNSSFDIVTACMKGREIARQLGFSASDQSRISLAISELARILSWSAGAPAEIVMCGTSQNGQRGLEIACLVNLENAANGDGAGQSKNSSLLLHQLANVRCLADESLIEEQNGKQARVMLTKWMT